MKEEEEEALLTAKAFTPCTLLKAGHHGDNKATGKLLLKAVQPQAAVILTSSEEEPDTPAASTLNRLRNAGSEVYVTQDADDAIYPERRPDSVRSERAMGQCARPDHRRGDGYRAYGRHPDHPERRQ